MAEWLTVGDVGKLAGLSPDTVRTHERAGRITAATRTEGGVRLFARAEVERWLRQRAERAAERQAAAAR